MLQSAADVVLNEDSLETTLEKENWLFDVIFDPFAGFAASSADTQRQRAVRDLLSSKHLLAGGSLLTLDPEQLHDVDISLSEQYITRVAASEIVHPIGVPLRLVRNIEEVRVSSLRDYRSSGLFNVIRMSQACTILLISVNTFNHKALFTQSMCNTLQNNVKNVLGCQGAFIVKQQTLKDNRYILLLQIWATSAALEEYQTSAEYNMTILSLREIGCVKFISTARDCYDIHINAKAWFFNNDAKLDLRVAFLKPQRGRETAFFQKARTALLSLKAAIGCHMVSLFYAADTDEYVLVHIAKSHVTYNRPDTVEVLDTFREECDYTGEYAIINKFVYRGIQCSKKSSKGGVHFFLNNVTLPSYKGRGFAVVKVISSTLNPEDFQVRFVFYLSSFSCFTSPPHSSRSLSPPFSLLPSSSFLSILTPSLSSFISPPHSSPTSLLLFSFSPISFLPTPLLPFLPLIPPYSSTF